MRSTPTNPHVEEQLKTIPTKPGCYTYRDEDGKILYVGKAINLRSRVRSYFRKSANHSTRIARMVFRIRDIEVMVVDSELEALVLECNLIKKHRPPYNVRLRDDKSYPYILITNEKFPRVMFTRNPRRGGGKTFGPYTSAYAVRETLGLLHKIFPLIPCGKSWSGKAEQRPCLYFHIEQCLAPCAGLSDPDQYALVINQVIRFLEGKDSDILQDIQVKMEKSAEDLNFERAAVLRDTLQSLMATRERQKVLSDDGMDRDIVAVVKDDRGSAVQMLYVRGGRLIGQQNYMLDGSAEASPSEAVQEFVKQYYANAPEIPREVLLPVEIAEKVIVQQWLRQKRGSAVSVDVPQGGVGLRLVELAAQNAELALKNFQEEATRKAEWAERAMEQLADSVGLTTPAARIEGYDISNLQGKSPVGSMVVAENGEPAKDQYRKFSIKWHAETPDDFAMMHEVITRRLRRFLDKDPKFMPLPDLIMIDGGKGQLGAALRARDTLGLSVPMIGLAKKQEIIFIPNLAHDAPQDPNLPGRYVYTEAVLSLDAPGLLLLRRLRDEAHRFALSFHRKLRDKRLHGSILDEIPGIGPKKRRLLLRTFGSIAAIRAASAEDIAATPTLTLTQANKIKELINND